jgi:diguanylate cyclase (GGDEF)-like protein
MASLRNRIAVAAAGVVTIAQAATVALVLYVAERDAETQAHERLSVGNRVVADFMQSHKAQLELTVNVLAADFAFRAAVASLDLPTVTSVLRNHAGRIGADQSMLVDVEGNVVASTPRDVALPAHVWEQLRGTPGTLVALEDDTALYQVVLTPVRAPDLIGWVVMGFRIDDALAVQLRNLIGMDVSFVPADGGDAFASSSMPNGRAPLDEDGAAYFTHAEALPAVGPVPSLVLQLSRADALAGYDALSSSMLALGAIAVFLAVGIAAFTSGRLTRHLNVLADVARRVSAGDYGTPVAIRTHDEVEVLADALTTMQNGIAEREQRIRRQATHDPLTDLPNHDQAVATLQDWIGDDCAPFAVAVLHFYGLQEINSSLGLDVGDSVIQSIARRLGQSLRAGDHLARIADSRFLIACRDRGASTIDTLAARLRGDFEIVSTSGAIQVGLSLQIGVAEYPEHAHDAASLVRKAWGASLDASNSKSGIAHYNVDRDAQHQRRLTIMRDMKAAVLDDQLSLLYQPKYDVRARRIHSVEALLRWHHPTLGPVPVTEFIEVAEQTRNIGRLTRWVLRRALSQARIWRARHPSVSVAVNVSAHDLTDADLPQYVATVLADCGLDGTALGVEVTEGALVYDVPRVHRTLDALQAMGVRIYIDDYGTGYSSLAQIRDLPVHALKIDRSFVMRLAGSDDNVHIVRSTIDLGHALELEVVAEGVEDEATAQALVGWGCDHLQGYYFGKPMPADDVEALFAPRSGTISVVPMRRA